MPSATLETTDSSNVVPLASYVSDAGRGQTSNYFILNGTSMAAASASGAVAALLGSQKLTPDQVKARLMLTATKNFPANFGDHRPDDESDIYDSVRSFSRWGQVIWI